MNRAFLPQLVGAASFLFASFALIATPLVACATISADVAPQVAAPIYVQAERAVIIWDSAHHMEHFIRQASLNTQSPDLGFLVPTPQTPELAEADPKIFDLAINVGGPNMVAPEVKETPWQILAPVAVGTPLQAAIEGGGGAALSTSPNRAGLKAPAQNEKTSVFERDIAGYHVTTLDPKDTKSVSAWMSRNGYTPQPALDAWLKQYADAGWKINAFKQIKTQPGAGQLTTRAIRLSFPTDHPYYPYSEPADRQLPSAASPNGRVLHVAVLSDSRVKGAKSDGTAWPGQLLYAGSLNIMPASDWLHAANLTNANPPVSSMTNLTTFDDKSNPRMGTADLYFSTNPDQSPYRATIIDRSLPTVRVIDWSNPLADVAAFAAFVLIPGVPLCCGWLIYSRRNSAPTWIVEQHARNPRPPTKRISRFTGALGIIWSLVYGMVFMRLAVIWLYNLIGPALTVNYSAPAWLTAVALSVLGFVVLAAMVWGVFSCAVQIVRARELVKKSRLQETLAIAAMFVGAVGLLFMVYVLLHSPV